MLSVGIPVWLEHVFDDLGYGVGSDVDGPFQFVDDIE